MLLFDNVGDFGDPATRAVIEFNPKTHEIVWSYAGDADRPFYSILRSDQERLANGNTLMTESDGGRLLEVTPDGEIVWEYVNPIREGRCDEFIPIVAWGAAHRSRTTGSGVPRLADKLGEEDMQVLLGCLIVVIVALSTAAPAVAYVGPGAGLSLVGAFWGLLVALFAAFAFVILWPIRRFFKRRRAASAQPAEQRRPKTRRCAPINAAPRAQSPSSRRRRCRSTCPRRRSRHRAHRGSSPIAGRPHGPSHAVRAGALDRVASSRARVPTIHTARCAWNLLLGNPAGYLPDDWRARAPRPRHPAAGILVCRPGLAKAWYVPFFGVLLLASLAIKVAARIE